MTATRTTVTGVTLTAVAEDSVDSGDYVGAQILDAMTRDVTGSAPDYTDRDVAIAAIKTALKQRSGKAWSVTGDKGTSWGWITITAPPKRRTEYGSLTHDDEEELGKLLGLDQVHHQGVTIPASGDYRREYVARAQGRTPEIHGAPYWD